MHDRGTLECVPCTAADGACCLAAWLCQQFKPPENWMLILANWSSDAAVQAHLEHTQEATQRLRTSSRLRTSWRVSSSRRFMLEAFEIALIKRRALRERKRLSR